MQDTIFSAKVEHGMKKQLAVDINGMSIIEITNTYSGTNIFLKYGWAVSCRDNNATIELRLQGVGKYKRRTAQVADKLNNL